MGLIIANIIGWITLHWRIVAYIAVAVVLAILVIFVMRACNKPPKLNQQEIQRAQQAIETQDRKTMQEILTNSDVRETQIDTNVAEAKNATVNAIANSKQTWANKSNEELAAELERRAREGQ